MTRALVTNDWLIGDAHLVMPALAGIHEFPRCQQQCREWRAFARHDVKAASLGQLIGRRY
jgi:hypothetical protein